jgi:hypothetical protein
LWLIAQRSSAMKKFNIAIAVAGILAAGSLAEAPTAAAAPTGGTSNSTGTVSGPLSQCITTGVHGVTSSNPTVFTTAYVDVSCRRATTSAAPGTR